MIRLRLPVLRRLARSRKSPALTNSSTPDTATGTITFTDVDWTDTHAVMIVSSVSASGVTTGLASGAVQLTWLSLGALTDSTDGVDRFAELDVLGRRTIISTTSPIARLVTLTYTVEVDDHHGGVTSQDVAVTITGTNDVPVVAVTDVTGAVTELVTPVGNLTDSGTIAFTDVDLTDTHSIDPTITASAGALGTLTGEREHATRAGSGLGGVVTWNYSVAALGR